MVNEKLLDAVGALSIGIGVAVIGRGAVLAGSVDAFVDVVIAGKQLIVLGIAAIVGVAAVKTWLKRR